MSFNSNTYYYLHGKEVTKEEYCAQPKAMIACGCYTNHNGDIMLCEHCASVSSINEATEAECGKCSKKADVGCSCWWCGNKN